MAILIYSESAPSTMQRQASATGGQPKGEGPRMQAGWRSSGPARNRKHCDTLTREVKKFTGKPFLIFGGTYIPKKSSQHFAFFGHIL